MTPVVEQCMEIINEHVEGAPPRYQISVPQVMLPPDLTEEQILELVKTLQERYKPKYTVKYIPSENPGFSTMGRFIIDPVF